MWVRWFPWLDFLIVIWLMSNAIIFMCLLLGFVVVYLKPIVWTDFLEHLLLLIKWHSNACDACGEEFEWT